MNDTKTIIGVDIAKRVFQVHEVDAGTGELRRVQLKRAKFLEYFANRAPCLIGMEACGGAQHWARRLTAMGHAVKLLPARQVRPFAGGNKSDQADAQAIWTAVQQPGIKAVAIKTEAQQAVLALHRMRQQLVKFRTAQINALRGLLTEYGEVMPRGRAALRKGVVDAFAHVSERLPRVLVDTLREQFARIRRLDDEIVEIERRLTDWFKEDAACRRIAAVPGAEEALYDPEAMRRFVGIDLGSEAAPDESTVLQFRHLLERHGLANRMLATVNSHLVAHGMKLSRGTIVDATIIAAPPSTKNQDKARDPEMHQTKKGNQWYFGMKAHIGVDVNTGLVHTVTATAANVADVAEVPNLLRGNEASVYADAGYIGAENRVTKQHVRHGHIAEKRSQVKAIRSKRLRKVIEKVEHKKASMRAMVEHPFRIVKQQFGYRKVRYRGLAKNGAQVMTLFALANLWMARRFLIATTE